MKMKDDLRQSPSQPVSRSLMLPDMSEKQKKRKLMGWLCRRHCIGIGGDFQLSSPQLGSAFYPCIVDVWNASWVFRMVGVPSPNGMGGEPSNNQTRKSCFAKW